MLNTNQDYWHVQGKIEQVETNRLSTELHNIIYASNPTRAITSRDDLLVC